MFLKPTAQANMSSPGFRDSDITELINTFDWFWNLFWDYKKIYDIEQT